MKYVATYDPVQNAWELGYRLGATFFIVARYPV
jgi:hypothetical protein